MVQLCQQHFFNVAKLKVQFWTPGKREFFKNVFFPTCKLIINLIVFAGINPSNKEHQKYLTKLNDEFVFKMCKLIQTAVEERGRLHDSLSMEICQHIQFCQDKSSNFYGRDDVLQVSIAKH